jgi:O-antigen/teichoic acid export membrane protein
VTVAPPEPTAPRTLPMQKLLSGFVMLAFAQFLSQAIGFAALAVASRKLGPENLGPFSWAMGVAKYFVLPTDFGITVLGIRDIAREPHRAREVMGEVLVLQLLIGIVVFAAMIVLAPLIAPDQKSADLLPIVACYVLVSAAIAFDWALRGMQRLRALAISQVASQVIYGTLVFTLLVGGFAGAQRYAWFTVVNAGLAAAITMYWAWRKGGLPRVSLDRARLWRRLKASIPIGISFAMIQVYYSIDSVLLGYLRDTEAVGQYAVAYRVPLGVFAFAAIWVAVVYPHASALFIKDPERLRRQVQTFASYSIAIALPLGIGATFAGDGLMPVLFGSDFAPAGPPFILLMWAVAVSMVSVNFGNVLLGCGDEKRYAIGVSIGALLNIGLNFALIPPLGTSGSAIATIASEVAVVAYMIHRFRIVLGPARLEWGRVLRAVLASAVMAAVLIALPGSVGPIVSVAIGTVVYVLAALTFGVVTRGELREIARKRAVEESEGESAPTPK